MKTSALLFIPAALITLAACSASAATLPLGKTGAQVTVPNNEYVVEEMELADLGEFFQVLTGQPLGSLEAQALSETGMEGQVFLVNKGEEPAMQISAFSFPGPEAALIEPFLSSFKSPEQVEDMLGEMYSDIEQKELSENNYGYTVHYANDYAFEIMGYYNIGDQHFLCEINQTEGTEVFFTEVNKAFDICASITALEAGAGSEPEEEVTNDEEVDDEEVETGEE